MYAFYKEKILFPWMDQSIGDRRTGHLRSSLLASAAGSVLEIGWGSGINLKYYPPAVSSITAVDLIRLPLPAQTAGPAVHFEVMGAEELLFEDGLFDTVVSSFTLCSVTNVSRALHEVQRVLKPGGQFLFLEHAKSWSAFFAAVQNLTNPFFQVLACGCNVNRDLLAELQKCDLTLASVRRIRVSSQPISGFYYLGQARRAG